MKKNKIAVFDIDGTIFRSSLLIELIEALIEKGVFSDKVQLIYAKSYKDWSNRQGSYENYINAVIFAFEKNIKGVDRKLYLKVARRVIADNKDRVYQYTRDLVQNLRKKNYYLLAISHSPKELVQGFCQNLGFDKMYGRVREVDGDNKLTEKTLYLDLISDKSQILYRVLKKENLSLKGSIGVGDSEGDITLLSTVENPICFNPNKKLYNYAKKAGWKVVVERKDVIYYNI